MPKKPRARLVDGGEDTLRERIARERETRGWSLATLAQRLTDAGVPIERGAIHLVEKGKRSVSFDEAIGLATVFGTTLDDLREPLAVLDDRKAKALLVELDAVEDDLRAVVDRLEQAADTYMRIVAERPEVHEYVYGHRGAEYRGASTSGRFVLPVYDIGDDNDQVREAVDALAFAAGDKAVQKADRALPSPEQMRNSEQKGQAGE